MISLLDSTKFPVEDVIQKVYVPAAMEDNDVGHLIHRVATCWAHGHKFGFHFHESIKGMLDHESSGTCFWDVLYELEEAAKTDLQECDEIERQNDSDLCGDY